ncbi:hypothetical protein OIE66_32270 [Nonomuraea sp. NBC_01738]|uniref:hypothetical protein n=1 Tax=Nonomuraea sp. NBC_01738 TaxID=2976003 RepID=UPI002E0D4078|nr:hypothetical protein OIE66_32270 [Nonomuraea sp. NBC_01738]
MRFSDVNCRTSQVTVKITNEGRTRVQYTLLKDGERIDRGQPDTGETNKETVTVDPGEDAKISVVSNNVVVKSDWFHNNCGGRPHRNGGRDRDCDEDGGWGGGWGGDDCDEDDSGCDDDNGWDRDCDDDSGWGRGRNRDLPFTGPPADLMGKLATAGGLVLTGGIVWWYGSIWPRSGYSPLPRKRGGPESAEA